MKEIRFDGQVAIVTGAGGGLGRDYALALAALGAKVVVNDLGGSLDGTGPSSPTAETVATEIIEAGGEAIANGASVLDEAGFAELVDQVVAKWGRIDMLVANAGILRDRSFAKMSVEDFRAVLDVHVMGAVIPIKSVWEIMRGQNYGRIVVASSGSGLYGNFGQSNYGAAKLALIGLIKTLKIEGAKNGIRLNAVAPVAATRMTEKLVTPEVLAHLSPQHITPGVLYLLSHGALTGAILAAGAGVMATASIYETEGHYFGSRPATVEAVRAAWESIGDPEGQQAYKTSDGHSGKFFRRAGIGI